MPTHREQLPRPGATCYVARLEYGLQVPVAHEPTAGTHCARCGKTLRGAA